MADNETPITELLAELQRLYGASNQGEWEVFLPRTFFCETCDIPDAQEADGFISKVEVVQRTDRAATGADMRAIADVGLNYENSPDVKNAEFIAAAHNAFPRISRALQEARAENASLRAALEDSAGRVHCHHSEGWAKPVSFDDCTTPWCIAAREALGEVK